MWETTTPEAAHAARQQGCVAALVRILGDLVGTPGLSRGPTCYGLFTDDGRATKDRIEAMTDRLAESPYDALEAAVLGELMASLAPIAARLKASDSQ